MANFDVQIQDLIGTFSDQVAMDDFMTAGAKEIINALPMSMLYKCADKTTLNNSTTTLANIDTKGRIMNVLRVDADSSGVQRPCRYVDSFKRGRIQDSSDMELATATDSVYLFYDNVLEVYPTPTANQTADVQFVAFPTVDASAVSTIANFPDEAEHLVVLYSAIRALDNLMGDVSPMTNASAALTNLKTNAGREDSEMVANYATESSQRVSYNNAKYSFYEKKQIKLQQDYDKGLAKLVN